MPSKLIAAQQGIAAETLAADYLKGQGLSVVARNLRCKLGELDLLCMDGDILVMVEVRQRRRPAAAAPNDFGGALASITWRKRRKITRAANFVLMSFPRWRGCRVRFDVVALEGLPQGAHELAWVKDAFRAT